MSSPDLAHQLRHAQAQVKELHLTRDAMQSSIDSLKVLISNERAQTRAAKRRLAAAEKTSAQSPHPDLLVQQVERLQRQLLDAHNELDRAGKEPRNDPDRDVIVRLELRCKQLEQALQAETQLKERLETTCQSLQEDISSLQVRSKDFDHATAKAERREVELASREESLRKQLEEKENRVAHTESLLRKETARVVSLTQSLAEIPQLRSRVIELEQSLQTNDAAQQLHPTHEASGNLVDHCGELDPHAVKKKIIELKIARNVIAEKDKANHEMRDRLSGAEARELEAVLACKVSEEHAKSLDQVLDATRRELEAVKVQALDQSEKLADNEQMALLTEDRLRKATQNLQALNEKVEYYEKELKHTSALKDEMEERILKAEGGLAAARRDAAVSKEKLKDMEDYKTMHDDFRASVEERLNIAEEQRTAAVREADAARVSLETAEKQVARLEGVLARHGGFVDDLGTSSPCSTDPGAEERGIPVLSYAESLEKMNELEEAANLAKSSYEQKCLEAQTLASSVSDNANTIVTLNRALLVSRKACDENHGKLETSLEKCNNLERTVRKLRAELASRVDECEFLENRIRAELEPSLLKTNSELDQRVSELKIVREDFQLYKDMAEKTRISLEKEVGSLSARLQETLAILNTTQTNLTDSKKSVVELQRQVADLSNEKREHEKIIEELKGYCEHRYQALVALESRLVSVEKTSAEHEQASIDSGREKESLSNCLEQALDRQEVAERRAARKDDIAEELGGKVEELTKIHISMKDDIESKVLQLEEKAARLKEIKEVVDVKHHALLRQAELARSREALFESSVEELRCVVASRDKDLEITREELQATEHRVICLTESLEREKETLCRTQEDLDTSRREHRESQSEKNALDTKLCEFYEEHSLLNTQYLEALDELDAKSKKIREQSESLGEKDGTISDLAATKEELERSIMEVRRELTEERVNREAIVSRATELEESLTKARKAASEHQEELSLRKSETESLSSSLSNAQVNAAQLENILNKKEEELAAKKKEIKGLELSLCRAQQHAAALESHLDDHDTLLKDCREKQEELAITNGKLHQATTYAEEVENSSEELRHRLASAEAETDRLSRRLSSLQEAKETLELEMTTAQDARIAAENSLRCTSAALDVLEKTSAEEIEVLKSKLGAMKEEVNLQQSSAFAESDEHPTKETEADLLAENNRLGTMAKATESELSVLREKVTTLEISCQQMQGSLKKRDNDVERLERSNAEVNQALSFARSKVEELTAKNATTARGEVLTLETKLEAKEKAIANLHNWCCFINGKLHAAEKALTEREVDLEVSKEAAEDLQAKLQQMDGVLLERESHIREVESSRIVEVSELRSRIQSLQSRVEEEIAEREKLEMEVAADSCDDRASLATRNELNKYKETMHSRDMELFKIRARKDSLENIVETYEQDLRAASITIETLSLELGKMRNLDDRHIDVSSDQEVGGKDVGKVSVESPQPILELTTCEPQGDQESTSELGLAKRKKVELMASRFAEAEKEYQAQIGLLEAKLKEMAIRVHSAEGAGADLGVKTTIKNKKLGRDGEVIGGASTMSAPNGTCSVTFTLDGRSAPKAEVAVHILGEDMTLGEWESARRLVIPVIGLGTNGIIRQREVVMPSNVTTTYKYAADNPTGGLDWESGENRVLHVGSASSLSVHDSWRPSP
eukprot:GFKZ01004582.1.p1 GENE.GFKZ01004582.1~~GFKZ01004582.1.p1  ORF type:complete len:1682 (-),score=333.08 GFKZ01004582.1:1643-6688(-)